MPWTNLASSPSPLLRPSLPPPPKIQPKRSFVNGSELQTRFVASFTYTDDYQTSVRCNEHWLTCDAVWLCFVLCECVCILRLLPRLSEKCLLEIQLYSPYLWCACNASPWPHYHSHHQHRLCRCWTNERTSLEIGKKTWKKPEMNKNKLG